MEDDTSKLTTAAPTPVSNGPVMDIVPPPVAARPAAVAPAAIQPEIATAPVESAVAVAPKQEAAQPNEGPATASNVQQKPATAPVKVRAPRTTPVGAIVFALVFFVVLTGLAYYAYSKG